MALRHPQHVARCIPSHFLPLPFPFYALLLHPSPFFFPPPFFFSLAGFTRGEVSVAGLGMCIACDVLCEGFEK